MAKIVEFTCTNNLTLILSGNEFCLTLHMVCVNLSKGGSKPFNTSCTLALIGRRRFELCKELTYLYINILCWYTIPLKSVVQILSKNKVICQM